MFLWIISEISIIACDVQGIIATAIALKILFNFPLALGALFTCFDLLTFMLIDFAEVDSHQVEWFFITLVTLMAVSFFWNFSINPPASYRKVLIFIFYIDVSGLIWHICPNYGFLSEYPIGGGLDWVDYSPTKLFHAQVRVSIF